MRELCEQLLVDAARRFRKAPLALEEDALARLMNEQPGLAARLLLAISKRLSDHLREANRKILTFTQVSRALQQELDAAHAVNRRLLEPKKPRTS